MKKDFDKLHNTATQAAVEACQAVEDKTRGAVRLALRFRMGEYPPRYSTFCTLA